MRFVYNLEENVTSRSRMGESFLYGNFERQHGALKRAAIPAEVRSLFDVDMAIIELESGVTSMKFYGIVEAFFKRALCCRNSRAAGIQRLQLRFGIDVYRNAR